METLTSIISFPIGVSVSDTKWKPNSMSSCILRVGNPPKFLPSLSFSPLEMSDFSRHSGGSFPAVSECREGRLILQKCLDIRVHTTGWRESYKPQEICDDQKSTWWMFKERSASRLRSFPLASICYHVPFRLCLSPWKIENRAAVTAEHCSWKCSAAIMSSLQVEFVSLLQSVEVHEFP